MYRSSTVESTMKKTMMYLPEEMHRFLVRESAARDVSMAEIAREAISEYRTRRESESPPSVGALIGVVSYGPESDVVAELDAPMGDEEWVEWASKKGLHDPR